MLVIAAKGLNVPLEENPKRYITDSEICLITDSAYYERRVTDGDLLLATEEDWQAQQDAKVAAEAPLASKQSKSAKK